MSTTGALIAHEVENGLILQRVDDGYVNATALCQASGKQFNDYFRLKVTQAFLGELSAETGIPVSGMVVISKGGDVKVGTWVHPDVAINLGQWCSPKFAVAVSRWVRDWLSGKAKAALPYHIRRYVANAGAIPPTHFSMLNELIFGLIGPMEMRGYVLPENMVPDISTGLLFCRWLREERGIDTDALPTYAHTYGDGRVIRAKLYPIEVLPDFRRHFHEEWLPNRAQKYFEGRSPEALPYLRDVLLALPAARRGEVKFVGYGI